MKFSLIIICALFLSACSTMTPPRYVSSVDNVMALRALRSKGVQVTQVLDAKKFSMNCRLMGPIKPADNMSVGQFITKAFNDEMKMAGVFSENGTPLTGEVTDVSFSSIKGLTNGVWNIGMTLRSKNGRSMAVKNTYEFKSGFDAITACNATADALTPAVQDLINTIVTSRDFKNLVQ